MLFQSILTVYAENVDTEEGNLLEPGKYTLEIIC